MNDKLRRWTLMVFGGYVAFVALVNLVWLAKGDGSIVLLLAQMVVIGASIAAVRSRSRFWIVVGDWLPLLVLPMLYWELPWATIGPRDRLYDALIQGWDASLFGAEPARTLGAALAFRPLSEVLHAAYLAYYAIIYVPPIVLYRSADRRGYREMLFALTVTVVVSFLAFSLFPVEGPRFAWGPAPVPDGPIRRLTLLVLEHGSARGTAFPSSHVAIALAQALSTFRWRRRFGVLVMITTVFLAIGAIFGGFHYALDVLAGSAMGIAVWVAASRRMG